MNLYSTLQPVYNVAPFNEIVVWRFSPLLCLAQFLIFFEYLIEKAECQVLSSISSRVDYLFSDDSYMVYRF